MLIRKQQPEPSMVRSGALQEKRKERSLAQYIFKTEKVTDRITRIYAVSSERMYLVEGNEKAALLDTGSGIGSIRPVIEQLTKKPLTVLLTHGHVDHAMGASEFPSDTVYINQEDAYIYKEHCTYEFRKHGICLIEKDGRVKGEVTEADFTPIVPVERYHDLKEGADFDLGGISIEAFACPGHTRGSLVFLMPEERMILLGDACNSFTFMFEDYSTSIEMYKKSLILLREKLKEKYDTVLASHGDGKSSPEIIDDNIRLCEKIMGGTSDRVPMEFRGYHGLIADKEAAPGRGNIVFNPEHIFGK